MQDVGVLINLCLDYHEQFEWKLCPFCAHEENYVIECCNVQLHAVLAQAICSSDLLKRLEHHAKS